MNEKELEDITNLLLECIDSSNLDLYVKVELMINLKTFLSNYEENIKLLKYIDNIKKNYKK